MAPTDKPEPFMDPAINEQFKQAATGHFKAQEVEVPDFDASLNEKNKEPKKAAAKAEPEPDGGTPEPEDEKKAPAKKATAKKAAAKA